MRISKNYVVFSSLFMGLAGFAGMGFLVYTLQKDLRSAQEGLVKTHERLEELQDVALKQREEMDDLEAKLGDVGRELVDVRQLEAEARKRLLSEIESRTGTESTAMRRELEKVEERVQALRSAADEHARILAAARSNEDVELRYRELMSPTVRINARHEVGSGTTLWSKSKGSRARTYVLTAWHIVQENAGEDGVAPLDVDFYEGGELIRTERGRIVARQPELDLALLEIRGYHAYRRLARLPSQTDLNAVQVFAKVYAIGCPLGYSPLPTSGELTSKSKELEGNHYWMINAPTIFGNSGGGIYDSQSRTLIGVLSRISAYKNMIDVAVPHMGLVTPMDRVYEWLDSTRYGFVYRDRLGLPRAKTLPASKGKKKSKPAKKKAEPSGK